MKYLTVEELDEIAKELIENPSKETLKKISDKYNGETKIETSGINENWVEVRESENSSNKEATKTNMDSIVNNYSTLINSQQKVDLPIWQPVTNSENNITSNYINNYNTNLGTSENSNVNHVKVNDSNQPINNIGIPTLNIEPLNTNNIVQEQKTSANQTLYANTITNNITDKTNNGLNQNENSSRIPFNGNLWEPQNNGLNNMMQTTDNFNNSNESSLKEGISNNSFFVGIPNTTNNPIPITENPKIEGPTMFGQIEQNFTNNAA